MRVRPVRSLTSTFTPPFPIERRSIRKMHPMRRLILGVAAVGMLLGALAIRHWWPGQEMALGCCWRGGAILAAAWLAFDDVQRLPNWLAVSLPVVLIVLVRWPRLLWVVLPVLVGVAVLRRLLPSDQPRDRG